MNKYYCDRCGEEIRENPCRFVYACTDALSKYGKELADKEFCKECMEEIVDFALNRNPCDACVQQMMDENAMLRETDEEGKKSCGQGTPDPDVLPVWFGVDLAGAKDDMSCISYMAPTEEVAKAMRAIRGECRCQSGQYVIPLRPVDPELITKYRKAVKKYGVPKQCINIPVSSSGNGSEDI